VFLQFGVEKLLVWPDIEPTTLDLRSQPGAYDLSAMANPNLVLYFLPKDASPPGSKRSTKASSPLEHSKKIIRDNLIFRVYFLAVRSNSPP